MATEAVEAAAAAPSAAAVPPAVAPPAASAAAAMDHGRDRRPLWGWNWLAMALRTVGFRRN